ncbi:MAG: hypothetical protein E6R03_10165 [Hyphomicrobiaceae bacterium]|nr:MAG: hypothetical protein E6R03_10165 [Hyphomicrobiaceae bacterium]
MASQEVIVNVARFGNELNLRLKVPSTKYLDEFIGLKCAPTLLQTGYFPNAKEITETIGGFRPVQSLLQSLFGDPRVVVLVVGDGHTPRTGAMFAVRTRWKVYSIDPSTSHEGDLKIRNLHVVKSKVEDFIPPKDVERIVIVGVHSHGPIDGLWNFYSSLGVPRMAVAIPCCFDLGKGMPYPNQDYQDWNIWSPERRVMVWYNGRTASNVPDLSSEKRGRSIVDPTPHTRDSWVLPQAS